MSGASRIDRVSGAVMSLKGNDMDTDRIIPARFLKSVTFEGLERYVFADDRRAAALAGQPHPFDEPKFKGAAVLIVNANFGCGSSREHAPQALQRWGIRAIIGESFADIFFTNATGLGLPCLQASHSVVEQLMALAELESAPRATISVALGTVVMDTVSAPVSLPAAARHALVSGEWDATGLLLADYHEVEAVAARLP